MVSKKEPVGRIELLQGTLDLIILQTLVWGPLHGYGISKSIQAKSLELQQIETGSLYPALHRMAKKGWIRADWTTSENKQRVREYRLTAAGRKQLARERGRWEKFSDAMARILENPEESRS